MTGLNDCESNSCGDFVFLLASIFWRVTLLFLKTIFVKGFLRTLLQQDNIKYFLNLATYAIMTHRLVTATFNDLKQACVSE